MRLLEVEERDGRVYDKRHGSPFDRGSADAYYRRPFRPHFFTDATYASDEIMEEHMTREQREAYAAGYAQTCIFGDHKNWD